MAAVTITAPTYPRTPVSFQAGEAFSVTLNGLGAVSGNVSLRWWRVGEPEATHTERDAWTIAGVTLTIAGTATRYLDGNYHWALWWEPTVGEQVCLIPASGMFVSTSGGFATADPDGDYVTVGEVETVVNEVLAAGLEVLDWNVPDTEPIYKEYRTYPGNGFLNVMTEIDGVTIQLGAENQAQVYNGAATALSNGYAAYVHGANVNRLDARPAYNSINMGHRVFGLATNNIASHTDGRVTTFGEVHGLNTQAFAPGTRLYTSGTPGVLTDVPVPGDSDGACIGIVIVQHPNLGSIFVNPDVIARLAGTTANRPTTPRLGEPYFDTTIQSTVVWNGTAWAYPIAPGYIDLLGDIEQASAVGALTNEAYRDTPVAQYWWRRDQDDTVYLKFQMPHGWDLGAVEPHVHVIGAASVTGNVRFSGRYAWSRIGALALPAWSGWTTFAVTKQILGTDQWVPNAVSLGTFTPPAAAKGPSAFLYMQITRPGSTDVLDTYEGDKPSPGTAAANLMFEGLDCHVKVDHFGTAGLYS